MNTPQLPKLAKLSARLAENNARVERLVDAHAARANATPVQAARPRSRHRASRSLIRLIAASGRAGATQAPCESPPIATATPRQ